MDKKERVRFLVLTVAAILVVAAIGYLSGNVDSGKRLTSLVVTNLNADTSPDAVERLERHVARIDGVTFAYASRKTGNLKVRHQKDMNIEEVRRAVHAAGFFLEGDEVSASGEAMREIPIERQ